MKIVIVGLGGVGKGSAGEILAEKLGFKFKSAGHYFRAIAGELGISPPELEELSKTNPEYDIRVDNETEAFGRKNDDFVFDGRIVHYFIPDSEKILLICDDKERFRRLALRDNMSFEKAREVTLRREEAARERYKNLYSITKFDDPADFGLVIDTTVPCAKDVAFQIEEFVKGEKPRKRVKEFA